MPGPLRVCLYCLRHLRAVTQDALQDSLWDDLYRSNSRTWRGNARVPLPIQSGDALDLGCGNGKTSSTLIDNGLRVAGVDFSSEAVEICRKRFQGRAEFLQCDITSLPFGDSSFDYITAVHVLEHLDSDGLRKASGEIQRMLRPGGCLFVRSFAPGDLREAGRRDGIRYVHRLPEEIVQAFPEMEAVSAELVEDTTRFGAVRRRSECLFRKPRAQQPLTTQLR